MQKQNQMLLTNRDGISYALEFKMWEDINRAKNEKITKIEMKESLKNLSDKEIQAQK